LRFFSFPKYSERAIALMLVLMRKQLFPDGNKRTAMLAASVWPLAQCHLVSLYAQSHPANRFTLPETAEEFTFVKAQLTL
jgi:hypothetical protein